jgi:hypothetical protein
MKISLDLDGTLYRYPDFFRMLMIALQSAGHEVGILTGHSQDSEAHDRQKLARMGFPPPDFYFGRTPEYMPLNGAHRKSDVIRTQGIAMHFDDYDYDNPETIRLFRELGQENHVCRLKGTP